jgi:fatty-acyl-CoA synthase
MVVVGGENVFPRELEDALIEHDDITDVVVKGIDDEKFGQALAAYVVVKYGTSLSEEQLVAYAKENVPRYAVPRKVKFLDELPRNPTGKILKRELAKHEVDGQTGQIDNETVQPDSEESKSEESKSE